MKGFSRNVVGSDPDLSLKELKENVERWIEIFGEDAKFRTDAGYNNCQLIIDNTVKAKKRKSEGM